MANHYELHQISLHATQVSIGLSDSLDVAVTLYDEGYVYICVPESSPVDVSVALDTNSLFPADQRDQHLVLMYTCREDSSTVSFSLDVTEGFCLTTDKVQTYPLLQKHVLYHESKQPVDVVVCSAAGIRVNRA